MLGKRKFIAKGSSSNNRRPTKYRRTFNRKRPTSTTSRPGTGVYNLRRKLPKRRYRRIFRRYSKRSFKLRQINTFKQYATSGAVRIPIRFPKFQVPTSSFSRRFYSRSPIYTITRYSGNHPINYYTGDPLVYQGSVKNVIFLEPGLYEPRIAGPNATAAGHWPGIWRRTNTQNRPDWIEYGPDWANVARYWHIGTRFEMTVTCDPVQFPYKFDILIGRIKAVGNSSLSDKINNWFDWDANTIPDPGLFTTIYRKTVRLQDFETTDTGVRQRKFAFYFAVNAEQRHGRNWQPPNDVTGWYNFSMEGHTFITIRPTTAEQQYNNDLNDFSKNDTAIVNAPPQMAVSCRLIHFAKFGDLPLPMAN